MWDVESCSCTLFFTFSLFFFFPHCFLISLNLQKFSCLVYMSTVEFRKKITTAVLLNDNMHYIFSTISSIHLVYLSWMPFTTNYVFFLLYKHFLKCYLFLLCKLHMDSITHTCCSLSHLGATGICGAGTAVWGTGKGLGAEEGAALFMG